MSKKTISFVSTRGRGLNTDLQLVKDNLMAALPEVEFEYYLNKTATKIPLINTKMEDARRTFCTEAQNIICMDPSIPIKIPSASERERRLLLATPFDYQFNIFMKYHDNPDQPKKQTFIRCTHVMPGSPFTAKLFHSFYEWEDNVTFLDDIPLPISWDILQEEKRTTVKKQLEFYFPQAKDKKILSILLVGQKPEPEDGSEPVNLFDNFNLKKIMDYIDDDWFVITNNWDLVELSYQLPYQYSSKFGYIKNKISLNDMMYLSDMLITNSSKHAGNFSITKKPIYYEFTSCPAAEFAIRHGLTDIMPALCNVDYASMELLHAKLVRTTTCVDGCRCDYTICGDKNPYLKGHPEYRDEAGFRRNR